MNLKNLLTLLVLLAMFLPVIYVLKYENDKSKEISINHLYSSDPHAKRGVTILYQTNLPDSLKSTLEKVVYYYDQKYSLHDSLFIRDSLLFSVHHSDTFVENPLAVSKTKTIYLNRTIIPTMNCMGFRNLIAHELFHTLASGTRTLITPFYVDEQNLVISYSGLNFNLNRHDNNGIIKIEEAAADVCAFKLYQDYYILNSKYYRGAKLMKILVDSNWISANDLISATKSNDVPGVCGLILSMNPKLVGRNEVVFIGGMFEKAWLGYEYKSDLEFIYKVRHKK